jgi:magnesium-transporting ATPase (P-type)
LLGILSLFLTRVFVVALIILVAAVVQSGFPFDPAQLTILTLLTVGIPTFALALFAQPGLPPAHFIEALFRFVLPAAVLLGVFGFGTHAFMYFRHDVDLAALRDGGVVAQDDVQVVDQVARDALTYLLVLGGLWLVVFAAPPTRWWAVIEEATGDWRPTWVAIGMLPLYVAFLWVPPIRDFFGVNRLPAVDYLIIGLLSIVWAMLLRYAWKARLFDRLFGYGGSA